MKTKIMLILIFTLFFISWCNHDKKVISDTMQDTLTNTELKYYTGTEQSSSDVKSSKIYSELGYYTDIDQPPSDLNLSKIYWLYCNWTWYADDDNNNIFLKELKSKLNIDNIVEYSYKIKKMDNRIAVRYYGDYINKIMISELPNPSTSEDREKLNNKYKKVLDEYESLYKYFNDKENKKIYEVKKLTKSEIINALLYNDIKGKDVWTYLYYLVFADIRSWNLNDNISFIQCNSIKYKNIPSMILLSNIYEYGSSWPKLNTNKEIEINKYKSIFWALNWEVFDKYFNWWRSKYYDPMNSMWWNMIARIDNYANTKDKIYYQWVMETVNLFIEDYLKN